jgi:ribose-phosphate pyrophosphokinase
VNIHAENTLKKFNVPTKNLSAITLLAEHFKGRGLDGAFSLSPDKGAIGLAEEADRVLGGGYGWLRKERDRYTGEIQVEQKNLNVHGKDVIVFDDIISTGGTIARAIKMLKSQGAQRVYATCVHPLLIGEAKTKIMKSGAEEIVSTDSITSSVRTVSLAPLITKALAR